MHILLVDNDVDDKILFQEAVHSIAPEIKITTTNYSTTLFPKFNSLEYDLPDFIFLDLNMEEKHGIDCLHEIKSIHWLNFVPVIIYSSSVLPAQVDATYQQGASLFVQKPSGFQNIKNMFTEILSLKTEAFFPQAPREDFVMTFC